MFPDHQPGPTGIDLAADIRRYQVRNPEVGCGFSRALPLSIETAHARNLT